MSGGLDHIVDFDKTAKPGLNKHLLNDSQISCLTEFSKTGNLNMENRKPYRSKQQKAEAKANAFLCKDGTYRSNAPTSNHKRSNNRKNEG